MMISDETMDIQEFLERVQEDKELLLELLGIFSEDYQTKRKLLEEAIDTNNCDEVRSIAHSLKGASGNISAKRLRQVFMHFEELAKAGDIAPAKGQLQLLDQEYAELYKRFEAVRKEFA